MAYGAPGAAGSEKLSLNLAELEGGAFSQGVSAELTLAFSEEGAGLAASPGARSAASVIILAAYVIT